MTVWLNADQVAERLGIGRRTALSLMNRIPHTVIGGTVKQRIRVSENTLDDWMVKHSVGTPVVSSKATGTKKKLQRR